MPDADYSYQKLAERHLGAGEDNIGQEGTDYLAAYHPEYVQIQVLRGIGYALLAIREDAGHHSDDLADVVHSIANQIGDLQVPADRIADVVAPAGDGPPRWWQVRRRRAARHVDQRLQNAKLTLSDGFDEDAYERAFAGLGKNTAALDALSWLEQYMRDHPEAEVRVYDPKDPGGASIDMPSGEIRLSAGEPLLSAADMDTVREALADALKHRTPPTERHDWYLGITEDERAISEYAALLARLGGAL